MPKLLENSMSFSVPYPPTQHSLSSLCACLCLYVLLTEMLSLPHSGPEMRASSRKQSRSGLFLAQSICLAADESAADLALGVWTLPLDVCASSPVVGLLPPQLRGADFKRGLDDEWRMVPEREQTERLIRLDS